MCFIWSPTALTTVPGEREVVSKHDQTKKKKKRKTTMLCYFATGTFMFTVLLKEQ